MRTVKFHVLWVALVCLILIGNADSQSPKPLLLPVPHPQTRRFGYIDATGKVVIGFQFDNAGYFAEDLADVRLKGNTGYIDRAGTMVIRLGHIYMVESFSEGLAVVRTKRRGKVRYVAKDGGYLKGAEFAFASSFSEGLAAVKPNLDGQCCWGYIGKDGKYVIPPKFEDFAGSFSEDRANVRLGGKVGFIDKQGEFVIPARFDDGGDFREGLAPVKIGGKWGYIDKTGAFVLPPRYENAGSFYEGRAAVYLEERKGGFIDRSGNWILPPIHQQVYRFQDGYAEIVDGTVGFVSRDGQEVIPVQYSEASYLGEGLFNLSILKEDFVLYSQIVDLKGNVVYRYQRK